MLRLEISSRRCRACSGALFFLRLSCFFLQGRSFSFWALLSLSLVSSRLLSHLSFVLIYLDCYSSFILANVLFPSLEYKKKKEKISMTTSASLFSVLFFFRPFSFWILLTDSRFLFSYEKRKMMGKKDVSFVVRCCVCLRLWRRDDVNGTNQQGPSARRFNLHLRHDCLYLFFCPISFFATIWNGQS